MVPCFCFVKYICETVRFILWKSERPYSITCVSWKLLEQFVRNKSIHEGLSGFLKQVGSLTRFFRLQRSQKFLTKIISLNCLSMSYVYAKLATHRSHCEHFGTHPILVLLAVENDRSAVQVVAGLTSKSLQMWTVYERSKRCSLGSFRISDKKLSKQSIFFS